MSLTDVGQHLVEHLVGLGVVGNVLEADHILEALAVLREDLLACRLVEELCWQLLRRTKKNEGNDLRPNLCLM